MPLIARAILSAIAISAGLSSAQIAPPAQDPQQDPQQNPQQDPPRDPELREWRKDIAREPDPTARSRMVDQLADELPIRAADAVRDPALRRAADLARAARESSTFPADDPELPIDPGLLTQLVEDLDADDPTTRELATRRLQTERGVSFEILELLAQDTTAPPERRRRLGLIARGRFNEAPKAGLGVQFAGRGGERGVRIEMTVDPNLFPAAALLQPGDVITSAHGVPLRTVDQARAVILSHAPGELLPVIVEREEDVIELDLPLGSYSNLRQGGGLSSEVLDAAWRERTRRWPAPPESPAIGSGLDADAWRAQGAVPLRLPPTVAPHQGIAAGGRSRAEPGAVAVGRPIEFVGAVARRPGAQFEDMTPAQRSAQHTRILRDLESISVSREALIRRLHDRDAPDADQELARDRVRALNARRAQLQRELERLLELGGFEPEDPDATP